MIGLDTNVLVRYLAQDDPKQSARATRLIENELSVAKPGFISLVVLAESCWVLTRLYGATQEELATTAVDLLASAQFHVEGREAIQAAVRHCQSDKRSKKAGFVDVLIAQVAAARGCVHTVTFDKVAAQTAGMKLLA